MSTASLDLLQSNLAPAVQAARDRAQQVFEYLDRYLQASNEPVARLTAAFASHPIWKEGLGESLGALLRELALLQDGLRLVRERMEARVRRAKAWRRCSSEIRGVARRLESAGDALQRALVPAPGDEASLVRWLEVRGRDRNVAATAVPLDIAPILREDLFKRVTTAVVTSATLASGDRFAFCARSSGSMMRRSRRRARSSRRRSTIRAQALLAVPTDFPAPNIDPAAHLRCVIGATTALATASDGGLFVLFTSHRDVREVARELRARGLHASWPLLVHGEEPRDVLLRRFRESGRAILLGTASFWEGVDVAGEALRGLVIAKLPFRVPTEPLTAARSEAIEARGGDSFKELMLPHATLRLKQGFGRLIRTGTDRGAVVLCDSRASTKAYGRGILGCATAGEARDRAVERRVTRAAGLLSSSRRPCEPSRKDRLRWPQLSRACEGARQRSAQGAAALSQAALERDRDRTTRSCCPRNRSRWSTKARSAFASAKRIFRASEAEARAAIGGFAAVNDVTARDLQKTDGQWTRAKGFDTFCPIGTDAAAPADLDTPHRRRRA